MERIFVLDDERDMILMAANLLESNGYFVSSETHPKKGLEAILQNPPDLILLDIRMPGMDGFEVCKALKANPKTAHIPVVIVSIQAEEADVVVGLELGAEDYVCKPFRKRELLARVKSILRRKSGVGASRRVEKGPLRIDEAHYSATLEGKPLTLAPKEFQLLSFFLRREGQVLTRSVISESVWGHGHDPKMRTIDTHVDNLRRKLGNYGRWIAGIRGIGYRFETDED